MQLQRTMQLHRQRSLETVAAAAAAAALLTPCVLFAEPAPSERGRKRGEVSTIDFRFQDCTWVTHDGDSPGNPFFPLVPGNRIVLEDDEERVEITTCDDGTCSTFEGDPVPALFTVPFMGGIQTRVIEEREWEDGELAEISHNFFARCLENGSVFYFGEMVEDIEDGEASPGDDAWQAGVGGAKPGVIMPGIYLLGSRYYQEVAPGVALDRARHTRMNLELELEVNGMEVELPGCVEIIETSPLDRRGSSSQKMYCPGIGMVFDDGIELVETNF